MDDKKTLKFQMMMSPAEAKELDDWMFDNRVRSRAEAIRRLCQMALVLDRELTPLIDTLSSSVNAGANLNRYIDEFITDCPEALEEKAKNLALISNEADLKFSKLVLTIRKITSQAYNFKGNTPEIENLIKKSAEIDEIYRTFLSNPDAVNEFLKSKMK